MPPPTARSTHALLDSLAIDDAERTALRRLAREVEAGDGGTIVVDHDRTPALGAIDLAEPWILPASGPMRMRTFVAEVPSELRGRYVSGLRTQWRDPQSVRSVACTPDPARLTRVMERDDGTPGYAAMGDVGATPAGALGACGPDGVFRLPSGFAFAMPSTGDVTIEVEADPLGRPAAIAGRIEWLAAEDDATTVDCRLCAAPLAAIEPGHAGEVRIARLDLGAEAVIGFLPRAGGVVRSIDLWLVARPSGERHPLATIDDWNPSLRRPVVFARPVTVGSEATLEVAFHLDNSAANPRNPWSPPRRIDPGIPPDGDAPSVIVWIARPRSGAGR